MAKKRLKVDIFSKSSVDNLMKDLQMYQNNLQMKCHLFVQRLAEKGVEIAKIRIDTLDAIFTGELKSSIHSELKISTDTMVIFSVVASSEHAVFVEFGTGQVGQEAPYPYPFPNDVNWNYNTGETIFEISPGQYGWFYPGKDGQWYFTQGMPARPFMYETAIELRRIVEKTAKEVFA